MALLIWTHLIILLSLVIYFWTFLQASTARRRSGIKAPATTGDAMLERALRVQQNTLEQLVVFIPAILLFAIYVSPLAAPILGAVWLFGRMLYSILYMRDPGARGPGFLIAFVPQMILLIGALIGVALALARGTGV